MKTKNILLVLLIAFNFTSCKVGRFVYYNYADITDHKIFPSRKATKAVSPFLFKTSTSPLIQDSISLTSKGIASKITFEDYLSSNKTVAYIVIQNDSIIYERYLNDYEESSIVNSFSMAKSILSILVGCAIDDGTITSINEPITNYLSNLNDERFSKITIEHLLNMTSGIDFNESYVNPFGDAATFYYGTNLTKAVNNMEIATEPGTQFRYSSGDSQVLGMVLNAALKDKTITTYLEEKIWIPLGMEYDATWSLDRKNDGVEKTFCCLNARARDFAKIGRLYLNKGNWNGTQIVSEKWVENSTKIDSSAGGVEQYQYQWWINKKDNSYEAEGILGQHIYVNPEKNIVIVRLGEKVGKTGAWTQVAQGIAAKL
ncbi:serine hydrolase domain-containing protein [Patiriisocius marinus]|uniref:serine hydrolase domain-containing protein n=1 Tax=Patiriisocius marinus TaxID=1397112 RepID=UPI00232A8484|nr:serine hydrolase [Patiriisocius marinus]